MFRRFNVEVLVDGSHITFRFAQPVSILSAIVTATAGPPAWQLTAEEFVPVEDEGWQVANSSFQSWPIEEAPPELIEAARNAEENFLKRIREDGPRKSAVTELVYGVLPTGYRSDVGPTPLASGEYDLHVVAEQGEATATFRVAAV